MDDTNSIVITEEMIAVGIKALGRQINLDDLISEPSDIVRSVYEAMFLASSRQIPALARQSSPPPHP